MTHALTPKFKFSKISDPESYDFGKWRCVCPDAIVPGIVGIGNTPEKAAENYQLELEMATSDIHQ